jgi:flagellar motility protein MotE (MotC chaperone)
MSKLEDNELKELRENIEAINGLQMKIGGLESQKHETLHEIANLMESFKAVQSTLEEKYGKVNIDITTGEIKEEDGDSKED